jgi:hypothetical protein
MNLVPTPKKINRDSSTKVSNLNKFHKIIYVYSEKKTKPQNILFMSIAELLTVLSKW